MRLVLLALDQGTTSSRAILFDSKGQIVEIAQREFEQYFPEPGRVEHDADEIWQTQLATARQVLRRAKVRPSKIRGIGITNQRETLVAWDRVSGRPVHRAIVWQDRRTADLCRRWRQTGLEPQVTRITGLLIDPYFTASKLVWLLRHVPIARRLARRRQLAVGTVDSWLLWKLSAGAVHATDFTNASRTMLMDLRRGRWSETLLRRLGIPAGVLPQIRPTVCDFGVSAVAGLEDVPIRAMIGDQQAALFGQACLEPGMGKCTYGTGCFLLVNASDRPARSRNRLLSTAAWQLDEATRGFAVEGSVFVGGAVVQWLRDGLGMIRFSGDVEALARSVQDTDGVFVVPAFAGLGAPYWDASARGAVLGITRGTTAAHIARAAIESIAHQTADVVEAMTRDLKRPLRELRVDGGASRNDLLMQTQADLLGVTVLRPKVTETTALGAALLAGLGAGVFDGLDQVASLWTLDRRFEPQIDASTRAKRRRQWAKAVGRTRHWTQDVAL